MLTAVAHAIRMSPDMSETTPDAPMTPDAPLVLDTRFGRIAIDPDRAIEIPRGLVGLGGRGRFALAEVADERIDHLKILVSIDNPKVSMLVLPVPVKTDAIDAEDLDEELAHLGIARTNAAVLLVVASHRVEGGVLLTINRRAPILVDVEARRGWQHVLHNPKYPIRQPLIAG